MPGFPWSLLIKDDSFEVIFSVSCRIFFFLSKCKICVGGWAMKTWKLGFVFEFLTEVLMGRGRGGLYGKRPLKGHFLALPSQLKLLNVKIVTFWCTDCRWWKRVETWSQKGFWGDLQLTSMDNSARVMIVIMLIDHWYDDHSVRW